MEMLEKNFIELLDIVIKGLLTIASAYGVYLVSKVIQRIKLKMIKLESEQAQVIFNNALEKVDMLLKTNIVAMENTLKKEISEGIKDGKVEKDELNKLAVNVKENVLNQLGKGSLDILNEGLNDVNGYIEARLFNSSFSILPSLISSEISFFKVFSIAIIFVFNKTSTLSKVSFKIALACSSFILANSTLAFCVALATNKAP